MRDARVLLEARNLLELRAGYPCHRQMELLRKRVHDRNV
jgi:hypothetical protein